jgi:hypothetical protein
LYIRIIDLDAPGIPKDVQVESLGDQSVKLSWHAPEDNGGSYITNYVIEKLDPDTGRWMKVMTSRFPHCMIENLIPNKSYQFRVSAENILGVGEPSAPTTSIQIEGRKEKTCQSNGSNVVSFDSRLGCQSSTTFTQ